MYRFGVNHAQEKAEMKKKIVNEMKEHYSNLFNDEGKRNGISWDLSAKKIIDECNIHHLQNCYLVEVKGGSSTWFFPDDYEIRVIGLFDEAGNVIFKQKKLQDVVRFLGDNDFYEFQKQDDSYNVVHYRYFKEEREFRANPIVTSKDVMIIDTVMGANFERLPHEFNSFSLVKGGYCFRGNSHLLYQSETMTPLFTYQKIREYYQDYPNVPKGEYLLVTKKVIVEDNSATLQFFIDKKGNLVSDIFDYDRGQVYKKINTSGIIEDLRVLNVICNQVREVLIEENKKMREGIKKLSRARDKWSKLEIESKF